MAKIIGITGSVAVGKSEVADIIRSQDFLVFDADKIVANLLQDQIILEKLKEIFPQIYEDNILQKNKLRNLVFSDTKNLDILEGFLHPLVYEAACKFIDKNQDQKLIFLEIPLLFEKSYDKFCDKIIVVYTDDKIQKNRFLNRKDMSIELFEQINKRQICQSNKIKLADYLIYNNDTRDMLLDKVIKIIKKLNII
jgi:dephospho-CoA kinase